MSRSRRAPLPPSLAGKGEDEDEDASHHPGAEEVPAVVLSADRDGEDHSENEEQDAAEHPASVRLALWLGGSFRALVLNPTGEIKAVAGIAAAIFILVLAAKASASLSESTRTVLSAGLSSAGGLLVVSYFREKLVTYVLLVVAAAVIGSFVYVRLSGLHPWVVHLLVASVCGSSVVFGYEGVQRLRKGPMKRVVSDDALVAFGCWLIVLAAVVGVSPL